MDQCRTTTENQQGPLIEFLESPTTTLNTAWTAARCNRLLRPITSKLALLRKETELSKRKDYPTTLVRERLAGGKNCLDTHLASKKRTRRTYSAKIGDGPTRLTSFEARRKRHHERQWQPTHAIDDRIRLYQYNDSNFEKHAAYAGDEVYPHIEQEHGHPHRVLPRFSSSYSPMYPSQRHITPETWMLIKGLYSGLHALLIATTKKQRQPGCLTLFSTCLRKVPEYIIEEQRQADIVNPELHTDISAVTYDDLEAFGSVEDRGWKPLRELVRAHGIQLLSNAVADGSIDHSRARGLVLVCTQNEAHPEAEMIMQAMLSSLKPLPSPNGPEARLFEPTERIALFTLHQFHCISGRFRFFFSQLANLFERGILPIGWISSRDLIKSWNLVLLSVAAGDQYAVEAMRLLRSVVLLQSSDRHRQRDLGDISTNTAAEAQRTIDKLLKVMAANAIMNQDQQSVVNSLLVEVLAIRPHSMLEETPYGAVSDHVLMVAILCTEALPQDGNQIASLSMDDHGVKAAASFLCGVARCCRLANRAQSWDHIRRFIETLCQHQLPNVEAVSNRHVLADIAIAAAYQFSEGSGDAGHLAWAVELEEKLFSRGCETQRKSPSRRKAERNIQNGLRWEEGISEWVVRTPGHAPTAALVRTTSTDVHAGSCLDDGHFMYSNPDDDVEGDPYLQALSPCAATSSAKQMKLDMNIRVEVPRWDEGDGPRVQIDGGSACTGTERWFNEHDALGGLLWSHERGPKATPQFHESSKPASRRRHLKAAKHVPKSGDKPLDRTHTRPSMGKRKFNLAACEESEDELSGL